uniref:LIM zinc-binding domain-containing protein n=1 Tax=Kwoniella dejecticola CBS 10117 TaxID=1296121 RepID=A0A1A6A7D6_9TREE|nr:uncharacterized protein I303_03685 [Kwoniella dejecticola CBS 10117]OBR85970.1 hypothetical protein I303_03685 [Kwoniella dejecticola CBS 10117]
MIVCSLCGVSLSDAESRCTKCYGRAIERPNPVKALLSSPQKRGSPDRWADKYTMSTSTSRISSSPLFGDRVGNSEAHSLPSRPAFARQETFDVALTAKSDAELARVYGSVLERGIQHPQCKQCGTDIRSGMKIYLAPTNANSIAEGDTMCRVCYTQRFPIGTCHACQSPIIGEREEGLGGRHISARGLKWHGKCFACSLCGKAASRHTTPLLLPSAAPACETCYETTFSIEPQQMVSPDPKAGSRLQPNKYPRPGQMLKGTHTYSRPTETIQEMKGLMARGPTPSQTIPCPNLDSTSALTKIATRTRRGDPDSPDCQPKHIKVTSEQAENHAAPPQISSPSATSVQDRIRQLNAQSTAGITKMAPSPTKYPRHPLYPVSKTDNR